MEEIIQFDKQLLLMVNGSDSLFLDYLILTLTNAKIGSACNPSVLSFE